MVFKAPALAGAAMPNLTGDDLDSKNRTYHIVQDHMRLLPNYYEWTYGCAKKYIKGDVIELGCGAGIGIKTYMPSVGGIYAVDHSTELLDTIRQEYPNDQKVKTVLADLMADWTSLSEIKADTVILMDVLEHFKDDRDFLRKIAIAIFLRKIVFFRSENKAFSHVRTRYHFVEQKLFWAF